MNKEFNPSEYKTYEELPEEQKQNFETVENDKDFVLKTVEKNPEIAHRLAIIEDQTINILQQEIETNDLSFEDLLAQYTTAAKKWDYKEKKRTSELLRQIADHDILRGGEYDERMKEEFKKGYDTLAYSEKTQNSLVEKIEKSDLEIGAKLLNDEKFSLKSELLKKIGDNDDSLKELYQLAKGNLDTTSLIINKVRDVNAKIEMFKDVVAKTKNNQDQEPEKNELTEQTLNSIKENVANSLSEEKKFDTILQLIDDGCIETKNLERSFRKLDSDQFLGDLVPRVKSEKEVAYLFKFIADKNTFSKIIENSEQFFAKLPEPERQSALALAKKFFNALSQEPEVYQAGRLKESNKFVVGIPSESDKLFIAWSNTGDHEYHNDIFRSLSRHSGQEFPDDLRSGGYIEVGRENENRFHVLLTGCSGDFGYYSHRVLEQFKEKILKTLQEKLGSENIELDIEMSR